MKAGVNSSSLFLRKSFLRKLVALVLFFLPVGMMRAQEPEQWPQDDDYPQQQPSYEQPQYPQAQPQYGQQPPNYAYGQPEQPEYAPPGYGQAMPAQGMNAQQLEQLLAPIAIYPDTLIAQILAAATYPAQVAAADQWMRSMGGAPPEQIAAGANAQPWDPSVKALTAYPQVLSMMNQNLQWTTALGNAYYNQPQDVLETVQVLRQRAQAAGNLQSTPQEQVTNEQGYIAVAPANPEVVYVPTYNPWVVYGQPIVAYPGYEPIDTVGAIVGATVQFGLQFAVGAFLAPFNLLGWGLDWFGHAILFDHDVWYCHSRSVRDWGFAHGGPRAFRGGEWARYGDRFGRGGYGGGGYGRGGYGRGGWNGGHGSGYGNGYQGGYNQGGSGYNGRTGGGYPRPVGPSRPVAPGQGGALAYNGRSGSGYPRPVGPSRPVAPGGQQYAYNRGPMAGGMGRQQGYPGNQQMFGNRGQNYGYGRSPQVGNYGYGSRPAAPSGASPRPMPGWGGGQGYRAPAPAYRAPTPSFGRSFSQPSGNAFASNYGHSSGGHSFFGGGGRSSAPSFGGGHSFFGGGHSSAPSFGGGGHGFSGGGGHSFFGGGGHSFGGGHGFGGGGHSFGGGGHSGGGHSGGGGHGGHHR